MGDKIELPVYDLEKADDWGPERKCVYVLVRFDQLMNLIEKRQIFKIDLKKKISETLDELLPDKNERPKTED